MLKYYIIVDCTVVKLNNKLELDCLLSDCWLWLIIIVVCLHCSVCVITIDQLSIFFVVRDSSSDQFQFYWPNSATYSCRHWWWGKLRLSVWGGRRRLHPHWSIGAGWGGGHWSGGGRSFHIWWEVQSSRSPRGSLTSRLISTCPSIGWLVSGSCNQFHRKSRGLES